MLVAALVSACGKPAIKYPVARSLAVGTIKTEYRDYLGYKVCQMEPKPVGDDLERMNQFLQQFLAASDAARNGSANDAQMAALQAAPKTLKSPLVAQESLTKRVAACKEFQGQPLVESAKKGQALVAEVRARLAELPSLSAQAKAIQAIKAWKEQQEAEQQSEKSNWCPAKPSKTPEIYYAWEDENGQTEWLFCDGAKVVAGPGDKPPELVPAPESARKPGSPRPPPVSTYLSSAQRFPPKEIRRAPRVPEAAEPANKQ